MEFNFDPETEGESHKKFVYIPFKLWMKLLLRVQRNWGRGSGSAEQFI